MKTKIAHKIAATILAAGIFSALACSQTAQAQDVVPKLINYQGKLTDAGGGSLANGEYSVRFELFDAPVVGNLVWGETRSVTLISGVFNVALGGGGAQPVAGAAVNDLGFAFGSAERYLQTTIVSGPGVSAEQTLAPRQQLTSVPYAIEAFNGVPPGTIIPFAGTVIPAGWIRCDGGLYDGADPLYANLYAAIQTEYGAGAGAGFRVPDMRGRVPVGLDTQRDGQYANRVRLSGAGNSGVDIKDLGDSGGSDAHTITESEMPRHNHDYHDPGHSHRQTVSPYVGGSYYAATAPSLSEVNIASQSPRTEHVGTGITFNEKGNDQPHNNMQPSLVLNYIIKL